MRLPSFSRQDLRSERRLARIARWDRPITGFWQRIYAWTNMILSDHGIFRLFYLNFHQVTPQFWRAAQPAPHDIKRLARQGLKTIINLRGGREFGSWPLEKEAAEQNGITILDFTLRSRGAPEREAMLKARAFFADLDTPALIHCKSGADRAGFMATLYLLLHENRPLDEAMRQLSPRYGHFKWSKTGILDAFFELYRRDGLDKGLTFEDWIADHYDPEALQRDFHAGFWSTLLVDHLLRRE